MDSILKIMKKEAGHKVYILGNKCYRCGHIWQPRNIDERPAVCPKCKNPYWYKPRQNKNNPKKSEKTTGQT